MSIFDFIAPGGREVQRPQVLRIPQEPRSVPAALTLPSSFRPELQLQYRRSLEPSVSSRPALSLVSSLLLNLPCLNPGSNLRPLRSCQPLRPCS